MLWSFEIVESVAEIVISSYSASGLFGHEVGGVEVDPKYHAACVISDDGVRMAGCVVEKMFGSFHCSLRWFGLLLGK